MQQRTRQVAEVLSSGRRPATPTVQGRRLDGARRRRVDVVAVEETREATSARHRLASHHTLQ